MLETDTFHKKNLMKTYKNLLLTSFFLALLISCGKEDKYSKKDTPETDQATVEKPTQIAQKITPCLWVEKDAKAVADYYLSIFKDGKLKEHRKYKNPPMEDGQQGQEGFETATIELAGNEFSILAAGPMFKFNEAVSFVINCKDQAEADYYWEALTANGGKEGSCGWCKDKYSLSWQVVPVEYFDLINSDDPRVREKAMKNTFKMKKLVLSGLK